MMPALQGQTVLVIGGSAGIGLETARAARAEGADAILTARNPERLERAAQELGAIATAAFDATDPAALERFFAGLEAPVDHILVTAGRPYDAPLPELDVAQAQRSFDDHVWLAFRIAQLAQAVRPGGSVAFIGGTGGRRAGLGLGPISVGTAALPAAVRNLALERRAHPREPDRAGLRRHAAIRRAARRQPRRPPRTTAQRRCPIGRVVGPADVAALAVHVMTNTALTGATYDIDGRPAAALTQDQRTSGGLRLRIVSVLVAVTMPGRVTVTVIFVPTFRRFFLWMAVIFTLPPALRLTTFLVAQPFLQVTVIVEPAGTPLTVSPLSLVAFDVTPE